MLVTRLGALSFWSSTKPQLSTDQLALTVGGVAHDGCLVAREDRVSRLVGCGAIVRDPEQPQDRLAISGHGVEIAHLGSGPALNDQRIESA